MAQSELLTIVLYDIPHDRTRTKVSERCLDYGLTRFQFSAFHGRMTRNLREELGLVLNDLIAVYGGKITICPIGESEASNRIDLHIVPPPIERVGLRIYSGTDGVGP
jgi:CRISPR-associated protein Cas2